MRIWESVYWFYTDFWRQLRPGQKGLMWRKQGGHYVAPRFLWFCWLVCIPRLQNVGVYTFSHSVIFAMHTVESSCEPGLLGQGPMPQVKSAPISNSQCQPIILKNLLIGQCVKGRLEGLIRYSHIRIYTQDNISLTLDLLQHMEQVWWRQPDGFVDASVKVLHLPVGWCCTKKAFFVWLYAAYMTIVMPLYFQIYDQDQWTWKNMPTAHSGHRSSSHAYGHDICDPHQLV